MVDFLPCFTTVAITTLTIGTFAGSASDSKCVRPLSEFATLCIRLTVRVVSVTMNERSIG